MISDDLKKILNKMIDLYGHKDALIKYERAMRDKRFYKEEKEEGIKDGLNYIREEWMKERNKKISSLLFETRILNFNDYLFIYSSK